MKYLHIILIATAFIFSTYSAHAQVLEGTDTTFADTTYDEWDMDSTYDDFDDFDDEPQEPETVKVILKEAGKETLNQLGNKASYEAGQFLNRQADKLINGLKQKFASKKKKKEQENTTDSAIDSMKVSKTDTVLTKRKN